MSPRSFFALLASLTLTACGSGKLTDLEEYVQQVMAREPGPIDPLPEIRQIDTFVYRPASERDPFVLDRQSTEETTALTGGGIAPNPSRRKEELEQFPLESLAMVGTLTQEGTIWALISTPERILLHVRAGNYLGLNNGRITSITENQIKLTEIVSEDGGGEWRERQATVALSQ